MQINFRLSGMGKILSLTFHKPINPKTRMATFTSSIKNRMRRKKSPDFSADEQPLRGELLSIDLLKQYARTLAQDRRVENGRGPNTLLPRLASNEKILRNYNE